MLRLVLALLLLSTQAQAGDFHVLELDEFSMDFAKIKDYRDGYFQYAPQDQAGEHWENSVAANFNLSLLKYENWGLYWNNTVHGETTNRQYRRTGWQFEGGLELGDKVRVWLRHHSQHALDAERDQHFPLENLIGCSITFYKRNDK